MPDMMATDFRNLDSRIAKYNLAFPLLRDTINALRNSRCQTLSALNVKDVYQSIKLSEKSKQYCCLYLTWK